MCGIALLVSGIRIDSSSLHLDSISLSSKTQLVFSLDDLKAALQRRGPDSLGTKKLLLRHSNTLNFRNSWVSSVNEETHVLYNGSNVSESFAELVFLGATLQLRGVTPVSQPLVDSSENILVYNGEIFGGIEVGCDKNDTEILMQSLGKCCSSRSQEHTTTCSFKGQGKGSVPDVLSVMKGPWAIIYWQTLKLKIGLVASNFAKSDGRFLGEIKKHEWTNVMLKELIEWERVSVEPKPEELYFSRSKTLSAECDTNSASSVSVLAQNVLTALRESMMRRISQNKIYPV